MTNVYELDLLKLSDGKLRTDDGHAFNIHKYVLSTKSDYFLRLFSGSWGGDRNDILIPGIEGEIMGSILSFMYSGAIDVNESNVHEILVSADYLLCDDLMTHVRDVYMTDGLSVSNSLPIYLAALMTNQNDLLRKCHRFIQTHFEEVASFDDYETGELPLVALQQFLGSKSLRVRDENSVWVVIAKWVQAYPDRRQTLVLDLLPFLAVSDVDEQLSKIILEHEIVICNPFCTDLSTLKRWSWLNLNKLLDRIWGSLNINILRQHIQNHPAPISDKLRFRIPECFHFILEYRTRKPSAGFDFYVHATYDEKIDLWREVCKLTRRPQFMYSIGDNIYALFANDPKIRRFNLPSKTWIAMAQFSASSERYGYGSVQHQGLIYVFGGISSSDDRTVVSLDVEVYHPDKDVWYQVAPMMRVWPFKTASLGNKIYVIGSFPNSTTAQSYDIDTNSWTNLSAPSGRYIWTQTFTYRGRLFFMGHSSTDDKFQNRVQVFDPARDVWTAQSDLPYGFYLPKALVVDNELVVYESETYSFLESNPAALWNEETQHWETFGESSAMNTLQKFSFYTQDTGGSGNGISKENKDPSIRFLNSPFN